MASEKHLPNATLSAKRAIFNKLCVAYMRSKSNGLVTADEVRRELVIPNALFDEALNSFIHAENQMAVEVTEVRGRTYLRLSHSVTELCGDWGLGRNAASKPEQSFVVSPEKINLQSIRR